MTETKPTTIQTKATITATTKLSMFRASTASKKFGLTVIDVKKLKLGEAVEVSRETATKMIKANLAIGGK